MAIICPMISCKRHEPYMCEDSKCAWWIGDEKQGDCAVKKFATAAAEISTIMDVEQLSRILKANKKI